VFAQLLEFVERKTIGSSFSNKIIIKEQRVSSHHFKNLKKPTFFMKEPVLIQLVVLHPVT
jgi:isoprenylcysteine carboxyl methyltransferase (ICMT) family protein YpbQ